MLLQRDHEKTVSQVRGSQQIVAARPGSASRTSNGVPSAESWKRSQVINAARGRLMVRPFSSADFGTGAAAPSAAQLMATNALLDRIRAVVEETAQKMVASASQRDPAAIASLGGSLLLL